MERRQQDTAGVNGREVESGKSSQCWEWRKGEGEKAKGYRQKNTGKFQTDVFKKQSEDHARVRNHVISVRHFCFIGSDSEANADRLDIILDSSVCVRLVSQLCPALCDPKDCSPTGSSAHRIF